MTIELFLFTNSAAFARRALAGGAAGIVIDWERIGKAERQMGADTLVSVDLPVDLQRIRAGVAAPVICRLDAVGPWTSEQLDLAVRLGADEVMLPMVRNAEEVAKTLALADGRCGVGILVETLDAIANGQELATLPVSRVYVGLNDLAIARRTQSIFAALADGTVEALRRTYTSVPFGFGGATVPEAGHPIPATLLLGELVRLGADFTFMRRSFWRDVAGRDVARAVTSIHREVAAAGDRDPQTVSREHAELLKAIGKLSARSGLPRSSLPS